MDAAIFTWALGKHHHSRSLFTMNISIPIRSRFFSTRMILVVAFVAIAIVATFGYHFRFHILWLYAFNNSTEIANEISTNESMPKATIPEDWVECSVGTLSLRLPSELVEDTERSKSDLKSFQKGMKGVIVKASVLESDIAHLIQSAAVFDTRTKKVLTLPQLKFECCSIGEESFHWWSSPNEMARNLFLLSLRNELIGETVKSAEAFSRDEIEGIALFRDKHITIEWQSTIGDEAGYIHVINKDDNPNSDLVTIARAICLSLRIQRCVCPPAVCDAKNAKTGEEGRPKMND